MARLLFTGYVMAALFASRAFSESCSLDPKGEAIKVEVLVFGAGIAGITAARTLEVNGITNFIVLEATDRVGGRIREDAETGVELGANWIHGLDLSDKSHHPIWREWTRCDREGPDGSTTPYFTSAFADDGTEIDTTDYSEAIERFMTACGAIEEKADSLAEDITLRDALTMENWIPASALENLTEWTLVDFCAGGRPEDLGVQLYYTDAYTEFLGTGEGAEAEDYLITDKKGHVSVVKCMAEGFMDHVKLNSDITIIQTAKDCVCATVEGGERYCGDYAIVTFSIGVLQAALQEDDEVVRFDPPLPEDKQKVINLVTLAHYTKIHLMFKETFWNETKEIQQILGYASDERGEYPYYILDRNRPNTITVDVAEEMAIEVDNQLESTTVEEIMVILRKIYSSDIPDPQNSVISNWSNDPFFRCSWITFGDGVPTDIMDQLLEPVDRLYFAGESLNRTHYGYTHGAYGSGAHVANIILEEIKKSSGTVPAVLMSTVLLTIVLPILLT
jgi:polyamine oxidase